MTLTNFTEGLNVSSSSLTAVSSTVISNVAVTTMANVAASTDTPIVTADPIGQITFYMPMAGGTVTLTGKGGTSELNALTVLINSLIAKLNALTALVAKIQKKVKA